VYADLGIVKTDNKDYFLVVFCIFGKEPFWAVISPKKKLSKEQEEEILDHVESIGKTF